MQAQSQEQRIKELERENKKLKQANEIIKKAAGIEAQSGDGSLTKIMIQFIDDNKHLYGVELMCRVLPIAPLTYHRAKDLVNRNFSTHRPNQLWVADFTYIKTTSGWVYTALSTAQA